MKCRGKPDMYYLKYYAKYHAFLATFHVVLRKVDYLWDSVQYTLYKKPFRKQKRINLVALIKKMSKNFS